MSHYGYFESRPKEYANKVDRIENMQVGARFIYNPNRNPSFTVLLPVVYEMTTILNQFPERETSRR